MIEDVLSSWQKIENIATNNRGVVATIIHLGKISLSHLVAMQL